MGDGDLGLADCESVRDAFLAQPVAATTSLAFVAGSLVVLARGGPGAAARVYAATMAATGIGSWWYHGPQGPAAEPLHDATIAVLALSAATAPAARRLRGQSPWGAGQRAAASARAAVGLLAIAGAAYVAGRTNSPWCRPDSLLQAHGLWHVLAAGAFTAWGLALWPRRASP